VVESCNDVVDVLVGTWSADTAVNDGSSELCGSDR